MLRISTFGFRIFLLSAIPAVPAIARAEVAEAPKARLEKMSPDSPERRDMVRVQIVLDRAGFRPGKIDGLGGEFTQKAADRYWIAHGLPAGAPLDLGAIPEPYREAILTEDDRKWIGKLASTPPEQEKLSRMPYADAWELIAERFHCDQNFLHELNPDLPQDDFPAGSVLRVPDVEEFRMEDVLALERERKDEAKRKKEAAAAAKEAGKFIGPMPEPEPTPTPPAMKVVILRDDRVIELYEDNRLVACFPCTPGSTRVPVPVGTWKVTSSVLMPYFRYDKSVLRDGTRSENAFNIPPGPNNYVGIVWMGISRPSVGMHGTQYPDQIGRNQSSGCIRLANWDAFDLTRRIEKGTPVEVR